MDVQPHAYFRTPTRLNPGAPLFVFLPGMDGTGQLFRAQVAGVEKAFDIRCLSIPADDMTGWEQLTEQVVTLVKEEMERKPGQPVYLCGESFGGCLAIKTVLRAPHLFDRLILVNPASSFNRRPWVYWGSYLSRLLPEQTYQLSSLGFLTVLASLDRILPEDRDALIEAIRFVTQRSSVWRQSLLRDFYVSEYQLRSVALPTLVIASAQDRLFPSVSEARRLVSLLPNAEMIVLPYSGHACLLEKDVHLYELMQSSRLVHPPQPTMAVRAPSAESKATSS
ncbi:alpha/beta fold hydrolase [Leptolyngbya ohadii]|uniref:alpha/beta fold hydrolase n=1 Tax=Leptolyngbya ohadii TaxID=1962290 RepID=UPI000B59BAD1|nr:alpha/beta hydrolase [Leptolyngbya ohadii]